jgi:nucleoside-diphosphate-sugar epimerase
VSGIDDKKLILGAAGLIGSQLTKALINDGFEVIEIDSFDETLYPSKRRRGSALHSKSNPGVF